MTARKSKRRRSTQRRRFTGARFIVRHGLLWGVLIAAAGCAWIDYIVRRDFATLSWTLPARVYGRSPDVFSGAALQQSALVAHLDRLGYRRVDQVAGAGQYAEQADVVEVQTRGFRFWDGQEAGQHVRVSFAEQSVGSVRNAADDQELALLRIEPVEIARFNAATGEDRIPLVLNDIPRALTAALISVEDQRFEKHFGIDPFSIMRAAWANLRAGRVVQGGSTLTQQLVKNLYLDRDRTFVRKLQEAVMSVALELHFTKGEILEAYVNEIFLGQDGERAIHGFGLAANYYFGRPLAELRLDELALLAGLPRGASAYNPFRYPDRALQRRDVVLRRMLDEGYISAAEFTQAQQRPLLLRSGPAAGNRSFPAFMALVHAQLKRDYDNDTLRSEGLRVFTTLDVGVQQAVEDRLKQAVAEIDSVESGAARLESALVITDANSGEVRALAGSRDRAATGFNRALSAVRPIGSLVKPAVYLAALESGRYHLASILSDRPVVLQSDDGQRWVPENYDRSSSGDVYFIDAFAQSLNLATVHLGIDIGINAVADVLARLGYPRPIRPYPSILLGAVEMSPIEVAQMYQTIAAGGFRIPLRAVEAVTTAGGEPLQRYGIETREEFDPLDIYLLEFAMHTVFTHGTARGVGARLGRALPLAGKTGTTNDLRDSWFAGFGDNYLGVVWLGHDDNSATGLTGATGALRVWTDVMLELDIRPRQLAEPAGIETHRIPLQATPGEFDACNPSRALPFSQSGAGGIPLSCDFDNGGFDTWRFRRGNRY